MRTAIFGGAFDPFHNEHRNIIIKVHDYLNVDRVVVVPSFLPPHKDHLCSSYEARREMVSAGTSDLPYVVIDDIELERGTVNPTSVTLPVLKEKYGGEVFFVLGGDSVKNFHTWIAPEKIAKTATLAVVEREGCGHFDEDLKRVEDMFGARTVVVPYVGKQVSSSRIKATVELGFPCDDIPSGVAAAIEKHGLYKQFSRLIESLKNDIPERTFLHCASTAIYAENFAGANKLTFEEVFIAALFHDCAKHLDVKIDGVPAPVVHQFVGAERAREKYGITDERILGAIRSHTSGKPDMTTLEKLIFSADMLEPRRSFDGVDELRKIMDSDLEEGFRACVRATYMHLLNKGNIADIFPLTKECALYYNIIKLKM